MAQPGPSVAVAPQVRRSSLLRVLGVSFGLAVTIGNTIGAGILRTPGEIASHVPNTWLFLAVWLAGAFYALLCAIPTAEIAAMLPRCGGHYAFARYAISDDAGFFIGWCDWFSNIGAVSLISIVIGEYLGMLFPFLAGRSALAACSVLLVFSLLQWRGIRWGSAVQQITSAIKALLFVGLSVALLATHPAAAPASQVAAPNLIGGLPLVIAVALAMQSAIYIRWLAGDHLLRGRGQESRSRCSALHVWRRLSGHRDLPGHEFRAAARVASFRDCRPTAGSR